MDESNEVRALLERAADTVGELARPSIADLTARGARRSLRTRALAVAAVVLVVAAVAVAGSRSASHRNDSASPPTSSPAHPSPSPTVSVRGLSTYRWRAMPAAPIPFRENPAAVWTGTKLFVWGGSIGHALRNDGALYDPATRRWAALPASPLSARANTLIAVVGSSVLLWGGAGGLSDGARFDLLTGAWSTVPPVPRGPDAALGTGQLVSLGSSAVLLRTVNGHSSRDVQVDRYDEQSNRWTALPDLRTPVDHDVDSLAALTLGSTLYLWPTWSHSVQTGPTTRTLTSGTDAYRLDPSDRTWQPSSVRPVRGYSASGAQVADDRVLFPQIGRACFCRGPRSLFQPALVNPRTGQRSSIPNGPLGLAGDNIFWTGGAVLSYDSHTTAGPSRPGAAASVRPGALAAWDTATQNWTRLPSAPTPDNADQSTIIWTGTSLLVWGIAADANNEVSRAGYQFGRP